MMQLPRFRSLRVRLITSIVLIEIVMLSLLVWSNMGVIQQAHADRLEDSATSMLQQIGRTSGNYLLEVDYASLEEYLRNISSHPELQYLAVFDRDHQAVVLLGTVPTAQWPEWDRHPLDVRDGVFDVGGPIHIGSQTMGEVRMGFSLAQMERAIQAARLRSIAIAGTEILLTVTVTVLLGFHLTKRLGRLASAARMVGAGNYAVVVEDEVPDEVGMTAAAFNRMVTEIGERTQCLEATLARERVIEETAIDGMITYGVDGIIQSLNPAMQVLFGYGQAELQGQPTSRLLETPAGNPDPWHRADGTSREAIGIRKDGSRFPLELYVGRVEIEDVPLYAATLHDITERKRAESECKTLLSGNRFLIHKSLAVQEEERRNLARELHDELGQCITAIQADAKSIQDIAIGGQPRIEASASAILNVSARIYGVVHSMMQRLRPAVLDDLGLVAAIEEEVDAWQARHPDTHVTFNTSGALDSLEEAGNISLYRVVQEALTNIAKHAQADHVHIDLHAQSHAADGSVLLEIRDDGVGITENKRSRGLGLLGMRERVEALQGGFTLTSTPGKGVLIQVRVPISANRNNKLEAEVEEL